MKKKRWIIAVILILLLLAMIPWANLYIKSVKAEKAAAQSQALHESVFEEIKDIPPDGKEAEIKYRLVKAWNDWKPDY